VLESVVVEAKAPRAVATVFVLHGRGSNARDMLPLAEALDLAALRYVFVEAPLAVAGLPGGRQWYEFTAEHDRGIKASTDLLLAAVAAHGTEPPSVFLGFSQGAVLSLSAGLHLLPPPAAIVALSGYFAPAQPLPPRNGAPLPPSLLVHGNADQVIPVEFGREAERNLRALGVPVEYREFPLGHQIDQAVLAAIRAFLRSHLAL